METTMTWVKHQPLEGRPLPGAGCYGNIPPFLSFSLSWLLLREEVGAGLGLASMTRKHWLPGTTNLPGVPEAPGSLERPVSPQPQVELPFLSTRPLQVILPGEPQNLLGLNAIRITQGGF